MGRCIEENTAAMQEEIAARKRLEQGFKEAIERQEKLNLLQQALLKPGELAEKLRSITDGVVEIFDADFCRIWITRPGDLCESECIHAGVTEGPHVCRHRDRCLHLMASSGRYTHIDGEVHRRVPFGCYKIGRVAAEQDRRFLTNKAATDPRVHNHDWVKELGLVSFAGYQLRPPGEKTIGVLALFAKHAISPEEDAVLESLANTTAQVIQTVQAEEALRESEKRLQIILNTIQAGVMVIDAESHVIVEANPSALNMIGAHREQVVGQVCYGYFATEVGQCPITDLGNEVDNSERVLLNANGQVIPIIKRVNPVMLDGRKHLIESFLDIGERKQVEEELRESNARTVEALEREKRAAMELEATMRRLEAAKQDAEVASQSKSEFLANTSHEIRTPMTAILGFADTLLEPGLSDSEKINAIHTIRRNGDHLLQIINDILDISKIEAGKLEVERVSCSPIQLLADIQSLLQVRADTRKLALDVEYIGAIPETIQSDPTRLKQILVNLVGNAIKFTETGGVRLTGRCVGQDSIEPMMQFDVIDSGIGMTAEQVRRLFQAFAQGDTSTTRQYGGTGLGLTISRRLAEMLGGGITVESKPGEGSTFHVTIATGPLENVKMLDRPAEARLIKPADGTLAETPVAALDCHILLAEDGLDNQRLVSYVLKKAGAEVTVVENGKLASDAALAARDEGNPFDVILMDMQMPVMDGYEATSLLRRKGYTSPIIALTAHAMASDQQKCLDVGCDDYASKPIDRRKLIETIHKHLGRGHPPTIDRQNSTDMLVSELADDPGETALVEVFVTGLPVKVAACEKALTEQDVQTLAGLAHQLKGSAGGYGFPAITQAAEDLETSANAQADLDKLREDFDNLADLCRHARAKAVTE